MFRSIIMIVMLLVACSARAENHTVTIRGIVGSGTLDSGIDSLDPSCCSFLTNSEVAKAIFSICNVDDECEIAGEIDQNKWIVSVSSVRKIDTNIEPSNTIIKYAAYWAASLCEHINSKLYTEVSIMITRSFSKCVNEETFWCYEFDIIIKEIKSEKVYCLGGHSVQIVRRNGKWFYCR